MSTVLTERKQREPAKATSGLETRRWFWRAWTGTALVLLAWLVVDFSTASLPTGSAPQSPKVPAAQPQRLGQRPGMRVIGKPIEQVRVGDLVLAGHPTGTVDSSLGLEIAPTTWRRIELVAHKEDGSCATIVLIRPVGWLEEKQARGGDRLRISIAECGIEGPVQIRSVGPCPPIRPGSGRIVTGTFHHGSAAIVDVHLAGVQDVIGTTPAHLFWSEDRQEFVKSASLRPGERLRGQEGIVCVARIEERAAPASVFNLEVHLDHVYHVSSQGILVHNAGTSINPFPDSLNLGLGRNGIVYEITGTIGNTEYSYVGSTHDPNRIAGDPNHPARQLLLEGENVRVRVRLVDLSDTRTLAQELGISEEAAAQRILRTNEQIQLERVLDERGLSRFGERRQVGPNRYVENLNGTNARSETKLDPRNLRDGTVNPGDRSRYGNRAGRSRNITNQVIRKPC